MSGTRDCQYDKTTNWLAFVASLFVRLLEWIMANCEGSKNDDNDNSSCNNRRIVLCMDKAWQRPLSGHARATPTTSSQAPYSEQHVNWAQMGPPRNSAPLSAYIYVRLTDIFGAAADLACAVVRASHLLLPFCVGDQCKLCLRLGFKTEIQWTGHLSFNQLTKSELLRESAKKLKELSWLSMGKEKKQ